MEDSSPAQHSETDSTSLERGAGRGWWLAFFAGSLLTFVAIPWARSAQKLVAEWVGVGTVRWAVAALAVAVAIWVAPKLLRGAPEVRRRWLATWIVVGGVLAWALGSGALGSAETVHLVVYGGLSLLAYRALRTRLRDTGIFVAAAGLAALFGLGDEVAQWLVPGRYWDLRDVLVNAGAAVGVQLLLWQGPFARDIVRRIGLRGGRWACRTWLVVAVGLLLCMSNSPRAMSIYGPWLSIGPVDLSDLGGRPDRVMTVFGFEHRLEESADWTFRSPLGPEALAEASRLRGDEIASALDQHAPRDEAGYRALYPPALDPFADEAWGHRARRDASRKALRKQLAEGDEAAARNAATWALVEHRILGVYLGPALAGSSSDLPEDALGQLETLRLADLPIRSRVGSGIVVGLTRRAAQALALAWVVLWIVLLRRAARLPDIG